MVCGHADDLKKSSDYFFDTESGVALLIMWYLLFTFSPSLGYPLAYGFESIPYHKKNLPKLKTLQRNMDLDGFLYTKSLDKL